MAGYWEDAAGLIYPDAGRKKVFGARIINTADGLEFDFGQGEDPETALGSAVVGANLVYAGPASGADAVPVFRALVSDDIPALDASKITTGVFAKARQHAQTMYLDAATQTLVNGLVIGTTLDVTGISTFTGNLITAVLRRPNNTSNNGFWGGQTGSSVNGAGILAHGVSHATQPGNLLFVAGQAGRVVGNRNPSGSSVETFAIESDGSMNFGGTTPTYGSGAKVFYFAHATTPPSTNPSGGNLHYETSAGGSFVRLSGGRVVNYAPAAVTTFTQTYATADATHAARTAAALTDNTTGTVGTTLAAGAGVSTLAFYIEAAALANGDVLTEYVPGYKFKLLSFDARCAKPVTTGGKAATLNLEIGTTNVTGGSVALSGTYVQGAAQAGSAITAANTGSASDSLSIEAASVTTFTEGAFWLLVRIQNMDSADALASLGDQVNKVRNDGLDTAQCLNSLIDAHQTLAFVG